MEPREFGKSAHNGERNTPCFPLPFRARQRQATLYSMFLLSKKYLTVGVAQWLLSVSHCVATPAIKGQSRIEVVCSEGSWSRTVSWLQNGYHGGRGRPKGKTKIKGLRLVSRAVMVTGQANVAPC